MNNINKAFEGEFFKDSGRNAMRFAQAGGKLRRMTAGIRTLRGRQGIPWNRRSNDI